MRIMVIVIYWRSSFLPPTMKLGQCYIFTGICDSVNRGVCLVWGSLVWGSLVWEVPGPQGVSGPEGSGPGGCAWSQGGLVLGEYLVLGGVPGPGGSAAGVCAWSVGVCSQGDGWFLVETPLGWALLRVVCILLECILVSIYFLTHH